MKSIIHIALFCLASNVGYLFGQAYQLSQFYAAPTFLNPAFAGSDVCSRVTTNYRVQWPSIPGAFKTTLVSFDHSIPKKKSGIGFLFVNDKVGSGGLRSTSFAGQYSYQITISRKWAANVGAEAAYVKRDYNINNFLFGDQIAYGTSTTANPPTLDRIQYMDLSSGIVVFTSKMWTGFTARHLNQPNQVFVGGENKLPMLYSVQWGTKIAVGKERGEWGYEHAKQTISPVIHYRHENKFDQIDIGFYYTHKPMILGIWYRGIPLIKTYKQGYLNNDAVALLAGFTIDRFKFGYSYDVTISRLSGNTGGAHEISISYQFCDPNKQKGIRKRPVVACPKF